MLKFQYTGHLNSGKQPYLNSKILDAFELSKNLRMIEDLRKAKKIEAQVKLENPVFIERNETI